MLYLPKAILIIAQEKMMVQRISLLKMHNCYLYVIVFFFSVDFSLKLLFWEKQTKKEMGQSEMSGTRIGFSLIPPYPFWRWRFSSVYVFPESWHSQNTSVRKCKMRYPQRSVLSYCSELLHVQTDVEAKIAFSSCPPFASASVQTF